MVRSGHIMQLSIMLNAILTGGYTVIHPPMEIRIEATERVVSSMIMSTLIG